MASLWDYFGASEGEKGKFSGLESYFLNDEPPPSDPSGQVEPSAVQYNEDMFYWTMRNLPVKEAAKHFLVCGAIGTGKTTTIDLFLQSIQSRFRPGRKRPEQLIVFDAKSEIVPKLNALGYSVELPNRSKKERDESEEKNVWLLNPFDKRSCTWNISEAVETPLMARHFAALIVPEEPGSTTPFFWSASRQLVYAVIVGLFRSPTYARRKSWDLRDLLSALASRKRIEAITSFDPRAKELALGILNDKQHSDAVIASLATKLSRFEEVAALWHATPEPRLFSIPKFLKKPGVLIIGNDPVFRESLWPINAMLLKSLAQEILRGTETQEPRHWFVLDEFPAMERVEAIQDLVNRGRSKGASVLIGIQGIDRLNEIYGQHGANDLLEQLTHKTFFRAGGPATAQWIESFFGQYRRTEESYGTNRSKEGTSHSTNWGTAERSMFLASFFMNLPFTGPGKPFVAVHDIPSLEKTVITRRQFDEVNSWRVKPANVEAVMGRTSIFEQTLAGWDSTEAAEFCGNPSPAADPEAGDPPQESKSKPTKKSPPDDSLPRRKDQWPD